MMVTVFGSSVIWVLGIKGTLERGLMNLAAVKLVLICMGSPRKSPHFDVLRFSKRRDPVEPNLAIFTRLSQSVLFKVFVAAYRIVLAHSCDLSSLVIRQ